MNLTNDETAKLNHIIMQMHDYVNRSRLEGWGDTQYKLNDALSILQAAKDRPQPAVDKPYRVEKSSGVYVIIGPDGRWPFHFNNEDLAKIRAEDFNKVHALAAKSVAPVAEHKVLTDDMIETVSAVWATRTGKDRVARADFEAGMKEALHGGLLAPAKMDMEYLSVIRESYRILTKFSNQYRERGYYEGDEVNDHLQQIASLITVDQ